MTSHIALFGYKFLRLNFTGGVQYQMFFSITDEKVTRNRWLWWYQDIPGRTQRALDNAILAEPGHHLKVEIIADDKAPATQFTLVDNAINLDSLIAEVPTKIGIAKIGKFGGVWVRLKSSRRAPYDAEIWWQPLWRPSRQEFHGPNQNLVPDAEVEGAQAWAACKHLTQ